MEKNYQYTAFAASKILARGPIDQVALAVRKKIKANTEEVVLIFADLTGRQVDLDLSGTEKQTLDRLRIYSSPIPAAQTGAGRPKMGVIAREISLLPGQWEWLLGQRGGASATIRKLIDEKIKADQSEKNKIKSAQEATFQYLSAIAGNLPHFEEAIRFLYRRDRKKFLELTKTWEKDILEYALDLAKVVFEN